MLKFWQIIFLSICSIIVTISQDIPFPRFLVCRRSGPPLSQCVKGSIEAFRNPIKTGNFGSGLKFNGIDPFPLDDIKVRRSGFQADLKKMIVTGAGDFVIEKIKVDFDNPFYDVQVLLPKIETRGFYASSFNLGGWISTRAKGRIYNQVSDMRMRITMKGHLNNRNGRSYIKFDTFNIGVKIRKIRIYMENAFPDPALNNALNTFINQNTELFLPEVEAGIRQTLGRRLRDIITQIYDNYPLDLIYPS